VAQIIQSRRVDPRTANMKLPIAADTTGIRANLGFIPSVTGTVDCRLAYDTNYDLVPVVAGLYYPFDVKDIRLSTSTALQTCVVFLQGVGD
jgi:hypothetical protein